MKKDYLIDYRYFNGFCITYTEKINRKMFISFIKNCILKNKSELKITYDNYRKVTIKYQNNQADIIQIIPKNEKEVKLWLKDIKALKLLTE